MFGNEQTRTFIRYSVTLSDHIINIFFVININKIILTKIIIFAL